jgi:hypothetical protein
MWLRQVVVHNSGWGVQTMKNVLGCLSMAALAVVLAAPVSAQTITLKASVPFDFIVGGRTMPAGDYMVGTLGNLGVLRIESVSKDTAPIITMINAADGPLDGDGAYLSFNRYGGDYFLAKVWDRAAARGCSIPVSRTEREKANSASIGKHQVVMVLARR